MRAPGLVFFVGGVAVSDEVLHIAVGDWIGQAVDRIPDPRINKTFVAALLGFASHALLDRIDCEYVPDYQAWAGDAAQLQADKPWLAAQVSGLAAEIVSLCREKDKRRFQTRLVGILGSIAPDVIDAVYVYLRPDAWQSGKLLMPWHKAATLTAKPQTREQSIQRTAALTLLKIRF